MSLTKIVIFFYYLESGRCCGFFNQNKMPIHVETANIYVYIYIYIYLITSIVEKIFLIFSLLNKIMTKNYYKWNLKFLQITCLCFGITNGQNNDNNDNRYDSKFLFYNFNDCRKRRGLPVQYVGHTIISEETHRLLEL